MNDISFKYHQLDKESRKEIHDFIDFLLSKKRNKKTNVLSEYKKKICSVSTWSDSDLAVIEDQKKYFSEWKQEKW